MSQHTPGPWKVEPCTSSGGLLIRGEGKHGSHPQTHLQIVPIEDARLIAAAPDLLAALQKVFDYGHETSIEHALGSAWIDVKNALARLRREP